MLRVCLRHRSAPQIAAKLGCDAKSVRRWAHGEKLPDPEWRDRMHEVEIIRGVTIPANAWDMRLGDEDAATRPRR